MDPDIYLKKFNQRYALKKKVNSAVSAVIALCGITALLYSAFINHMNIFDRLRYMTFNTTILSVILSVIFAAVCIFEASTGYEMTYRAVYFLRLACATTEVIVFIVVMFGLLPFVPDKPDVTSYTGVMMHIVIPPLMVLCFLVNDAPVGRLRPHELLYGSVFITLYWMVMAVLMLTGILTSAQAPYSFLDFEHSSIWFILACMAGVYAVAYLAAAVLAKLNMKLSWIWFKGLEKGNL